ncbi:MAG: transposase [Elusimicrobia bacterium]|nr:transposase [Elusimicrobiota bacterium]
MRKSIFVKDQLYHIYNRGVEKRDIFLDDQDHYRFIHNLYEMNNENVVRNSGYHFNLTGFYQDSLSLPDKESPRAKRIPMVDVLAFAIMPNHFHLLLMQKTDNGIARFMQKFGTGYSMYFNKKYKRVGTLFQSRFKANLVETESHYYHLPFYIHANPVNLQGKKNNKKTVNSALNFLEKYRWSSFMDYVGIKNFPSVINKTVFNSLFAKEKISHREQMKEWLKNREEHASDIKDVVID